MRSLKKFLILGGILTTLSFSNNTFAAGLNIDFESMLREYPEQITPISKEALDGEKLQALKNRDAKKMFIIGVMYRDAINVERDYLQAKEWFNKSAGLDNIDAVVALGRIQMMNNDITGFATSFDEARKILEKAVQMGAKKAFYPMAELYESGNGYRQSNEKAFDFYKKSAFEADNINGFVKIAEYYYKGIGIGEDKRKTIEALLEIKKRSIDKGVSNFATKTLGQLFFQLALEQKNDKNRFKLFELAWDYKNPLAADALGDLYQKGIGTDRDVKKAIQWYEKSISMDSIYGMEKLGYIYITAPDDIEKDFDKAEKLFIKGAELGGVNAAYYLGYMYHNGLGVEKNSEESQKWFKRSEILAERSKKKQQNDEAVYQTFGAGFRDPLKETVENNEKPADEVAPDASNSSGPGLTVTAPAVSENVNTAAEEQGMIPSEAKAISNSANTVPDALPGVPLLPGQGAAKAPESIQINTGGGSTSTEEQ